MKKWYEDVHKELKLLIDGVAPFKYGNLIGYLIQITGLFSILTGISFFVFEEQITYFARLGAIFIGLLITAIGKVMVAIMAKEKRKSNTVTKLLVNILDSVMWAMYGLTITYGIVVKRTASEVDGIIYGAISFLILFVIVMIVKYIISRQQKNYKWLALFIAIIFIPYRIVFAFIKPQYKLFVMVVTTAATLLLFMILMAFQVGDLVDVINPFKSVNSYYITLVVFMMLASKLVAYIIPKTTLSEHFDKREELVKIFMTWGMIAAMALFYTFDWKLLMKGVEGWSDSAKNNVLWSFTTYRLISGMLESKFRLFDKEETK